ncbi:MAG TPA: hypothetical protein VGI16_08220 [Candidatus Acidoferrum sp.]|jgi:hypothetical protein
MTSKLFWLLILTLLYATATPAQSKSIFEHGMWLCETPAEAASFQGDVLSVAKTATMSREIADKIAAKHNLCKRVDSDNLRPVWNSLYDTGEYPNAWMTVGDGKQSGWVGTYSYVSYMRFHDVVKVRP